MPTQAISRLVGSHPGASTPPSDANKWGQFAGDLDEKGSTVARPSQLKDKRRLFDILKGWFRADSTHSAAWRVECKEMYDFRAGDQWNPEDRQILNAQNRPEIVFNRVLTILKAVAGMEINGRHEVQFIPRHNQDTAINELLSGASKWMTDECDAEDEESQAFEDTLTCGVGWTEHRLDYELDNRGIYIEERIDPFQMYWDRTANRKNLIDARRIARAKKVPLAEAMQLFPGKTRADLDATWAIGTELDATYKTLEEKREREENTTDTDYDDMYEVTLVNMQWWEREVYWMVADPATNKTMELSQEQYQKFAERMQMISKSAPNAPKFAAVEMTRRVYKEAFLGGELLSIGDAPLGRFKWTPITGEYNHTKGQFFGLVKIMRDPQMWANKWLSQSLHILNTTAKGGIVAEMDAFEDIRDAEDKWARPDAIIWTKRGALSGDKPKIIDRPGGTFPQGHIQLMEFAISSIRDVTGINLELLGLKDANQPGVVEAQRKQAGMTVLATVFDSLRRFRKLGGRIRLHIIQNYLSDGRLIRVVGPDGAQAIPLMKDKTFGDYDVVIDDAPTSPNQKEQNWMVISQMLPAFKDQLAANPELLVTIMEYSPLPSKVIQAMKQLLQKQQPAMQQQQNMAQAQLTARTNKDQAQAEYFLSQAKKQESTALYDMAIAQHQFAKSQSDIQVNKAKAVHESAKAIKAMTEVQPDQASEQTHERHLQADDHATDLIKQHLDHRHELGMQRLKMIEQLRQQQHERDMAASQQQHEQTLGLAGHLAKASSDSANNASRESIASGNNQTQQNIAAQNNASQMAMTAMNAPSPEAPAG